MLMCVFVHSRFIENPSVGSWDTNPCFFRRGGVLSHQVDLTLELLPLHLGGDGHATPKNDVDLCHLLIAFGIHATLINSLRLLLHRCCWWWHLLPVQESIALF
jgi:hypothetical protein